MIEGGRPSALLADLDREREAFLTALDAFARDGHGGTVLAGWDARDLVFHVAAWAEHGADAVAMAEDGRGSSFAYDKAQTDAMNERIAAAGRGLSLEDAREREATAFARLRHAVQRLHADTLDLRLGNGDSVLEVIRYDGPDHYAEHAAHLRAAVPAP